MSDFYQSGLWKHIQKEIYEKPTFEVEILGKKYMGIMKQQRRFGKEFRWYMVHGVSFGADALSAANAELKVAVDSLTRDYKRGMGDILFQLGSVDILDSRPTVEVKKEAVATEVLKMRTNQQSDLASRYGLQPSRREHMPNATIVLDTSVTIEKGLLSSSGKRYVNKGEKAGLEFVRLETESEREAYREMRYKTGYDKRFNVVPKETFLKLMSYLYTEGKGMLFAAMKGKEIVSGAVYVQYGKQLIYLYGSTDRSYGNIGAQYRLTFEIMKRAHDNKRSSLDLLGVSPVGGEKGHDLEGVTRFKQVFGGETISYVGNYDIVFSRLLYKGFKVLKGK